MSIGPQAPTFLNLPERQSRLATVLNYIARKEPENGLTCNTVVTVEHRKTSKHMIPFVLECPSENCGLVTLKSTPFSPGIAGRNRDFCPIYLHYLKITYCLPIQIAAQKEFSESTPPQLINGYHLDWIY